MEFLFSNQIASFEALLVLFCVVLIGSIFLYDGYIFLARIVGVLTPRKEYIKEKLAEQEKTDNSVEMPMIEPIPNTEQKEIENTPTDEGDTPTHVLTENTEISGNADEADKDKSIDIENQDDAAGAPIDTIENVTQIDSDLSETSLTGDADISEREIIEDSSLSETSTDTPEAGELIEMKEEIDKENTITETEHVLTDESVVDIPPQDPVDTLILTENQDTDRVGEEDNSEKTSEKEEDIMRDDTLVDNTTDTDEMRGANDMLIEGNREVSPPDVPQKIMMDLSEQNKRPTMPTISPEKRDKLIEIAHNVQTLIARGHIIEARALIIEGLSLSKNHRELNITLAELYEREHAFEKAEYIYKDLAHIYPDDSEIILHLANTLAMQKKYRVSYELYKKVLSLSGETEETLYTLTHLASELGETDEMYEYSRLYTKQYPKNPEILWLLSQAQISIGKRKDAIETLIKLKNLTPYSQEIVDLIGKLVTEEEMAGNFGGEK